MQNQDATLRMGRNKIARVALETQSHALECDHQTKGQQNKTTSRFVLLTFGLVVTLKGVELCLQSFPSQFYPPHSCGLVLVFAWWKRQPKNFPSFETLSKFSARNSAFSDQNRTEIEGNCTISPEIMKYDLEKSVSKIRRNFISDQNKKFCWLSRSCQRILSKRRRFPRRPKGANRGNLPPFTKDPLATTRKSTKISVLLQK